MNWIVEQLWLIPALPLAAAGLTALMRSRHGRWAAGLAIGSMALACVLSVAAMWVTFQPGVESGAGTFRATQQVAWVSLGEATLALGWVLDPLGASMLVMVSFVGLLIFIYSAGYMVGDEKFGRFFCYLSLFAAAMLGLVLSNHLLLLFMCWEVVGVASYLLIGFWYERPSAAAAARKAFLTTRVGDMGFLLGLIWLYAETGTLLFYDGGNGCLESSALSGLVTQTVVGGMALSTVIGLLIFCGAIGKSGQVPLHVWLPDAMEGPTPVSALIHAATMVAAGVFLVARVYPLMSVTATGEGVAGALMVVTWVGATTALFAALIAVAQTDIKRILAYSTVSQLGFMMVGLGTGGVAVGMFHLITHAFFKALLFLGAGSVLHGCHEEQDIRRMGGLSRHMPLTFAVYGVGMLALAGVPLFAGFWSKDEILHAAAGWSVSRIPLAMALAGALLTAFYMTRQVCYVFLGAYRGKGQPHESGPILTVPLIVLAVFAVLLGFVGTPFWPAFQSWLGEPHGPVEWLGTLGMMLLSTVVVALGIGLGWWLYGRRPGEPDVLETTWPGGFRVLRDRFYVDELYQRSVLRWHDQFARFCRQLDDVVFEGMVRAVSYLVLGLAWLNRFLDEYLVNPGFDRGCAGLREGGGQLARWHDGRVQSYLRVTGVALTVLLLVLAWGWHR
jgi:NADH-quinone oxidoreductase subunit L